MSLPTLSYQSLPQRPSWRIAFLLILIALTVRVASISLRGDLLSKDIVGAEAGAMADDLVDGRGFSNPFHTPWSAHSQSPSTHLPPIYPLILAGFIQLVGMASDLGGEHYDFLVHYLAILLNLVASCLLPLLVLRLADSARIARPIGILAAVAFCFCPEALRAAGLVWDEALFATSSAAVLCLAVHWLMRLQLPSWKHSALLGFLCGVLSLLNPAMVLAIPIAFLVGLATRGARLHTLAAHVLLLASFTLGGGSPWHARNWLFLDPPAHVFVRGNFWLEVWTNANPIKWDDAGNPKLMHPWPVNGIDPMVRDGRSLTEQQYFGWCRERSLALPIFHSPLAFTRHVATQANAFWLGQAEARRWHRNQPLFLIAQGLPALLGLLGFYLARKSLDPVFRNALLALLLVFPLPYYLSGGAARYRHPIDFILYLGLALAAHHLYQKLRPKSAATP